MNEKGYEKIEEYKILNTKIKNAKVFGYLRFKNLFIKVRSKKARKIKSDVVPMDCAFNTSKKSAPKKIVIYKSFVGYKIKSKIEQVKKIGKENIVDSKKASIKSAKKKKYLTNIFIKNLFAQRQFEARQI